MQKCVSHTHVGREHGEEEAPNDQLTYIQFAADAARERTWRNWSCDAALFECQR